LFLHSGTPATLLPEHQETFMFESSLRTMIHATSTAALAVCLTVGGVAAAATPDSCPTTCELPYAGDMDENGYLNVADAIAMFGLLANDEDYCLVEVDVNGDGTFDSKDPKYVLNYLYSGGADAVDQRLAGDANGDGSLDLADYTTLSDYLFAGGDPPACEAQADVNGDCSLDIADFSELVQYLNGGKVTLELVLDCDEESSCSTY